MSELLAHAKAARALADAFAAGSSVASVPQHSLLLANISVAYNRAAETLEAQTKEHCSGKAAA